MRAYPTYTDDAGRMWRGRNCTRCGGEGGREGWPGWTCYRCNGIGREATDERVYTPEEQAARDARAAKRAQRKALKAEAARRAFAEASESQFPLAVGALRVVWAVSAADPDAEGATALYGSFLTDVARHWRYTGQLSAAQAAGVERAWASVLERARVRHAETLAAKPAPVGRLVFEGKLLKVERRENEYGVRYLMAAKHDDGWIAWGTLPSALSKAVPGRDRVRFTATFTPSESDPLFGFFKRPTKAEVVI